MILTGIDPGRKTGLAEWNPEVSKGDPNRLVLYTFSFWETYEYITGKYLPEETTLFIEDPQKNNPTFGREKMSRKKLDRKAQNVGSNKEQAYQLIQGFRRQGYVVFAIRPGSAKWTRKELKLYSGGYDGSSNEHERDAARLVVGRTAVNPKQFQKLLHETNNN